MNPDLNNLRRDLGITPQAQTSQAANQLPSNQEPSGTGLNSFGGWLLMILAVVIGVYIFSGPILALFGFLWEMVCAVFTFIFKVVAVVLLCSFVLGVLGSLGD